MYHNIACWMITVVIGITIFLILKGITMSRRKIKRAKNKNVKTVIVNIGRQRREMPESDIDLFLAENMEDLSFETGLTLPDMALSTDKKAQLSDLRKVAEFMKELKKMCFERGIIENDLQIGGGTNEGKN